MLVWGIRSPEQDPPLPDLYHERHLQCKHAALVSPGGPARSHKTLFCRILICCMVHVTTPVHMQSETTYKPHSYPSRVQNTVLCHCSCHLQHHFLLTVYQYLTQAHCGHCCSRHCQGEALGLPVSSPGTLTNRCSTELGYALQEPSGAIWDCPKLPQRMVPAATHLLYWESPGVVSQSSQHNLYKPFYILTQWWLRWGVPGPHRDLRTKKHQACTQAWPWSPVTPQLSLENQLNFVFAFDSV